MHFLAVSAVFDCVHHNILCSHERQLRQIDPMIAKKMGFEECYAVSGQTYSRKVDTRVINILHYNNIRVISHIAGGCSKMDNACRFGALLPISIDMAHYVMAHQFFSLFCHFIVNIVHMAF